MLKSLFLKNHGSHKATLFQFSPGLNVFVGESDTGKSDSFRAFYWLINNRPLGDQMRPLFWDGDTLVKATFAEPDAVITRMKGKKLNHYQLNDNEPVNAGNGAPPEEIIGALQMDGINFQTQEERSYLMFEAPGERGKILNSIAGLDVIDTAIKNALSDERQLRRDYDIGKQHLKELVEQMKAFEDINQREQDLIHCEQTEMFLNTKQTKIGRVQDICTAITLTNTELNNLTPLLSLEKAVKSLGDLVLQINSIQAKVEQVNQLTEQIQENEESLEIYDLLLTAESRITKILSRPIQIKEKEREIQKVNQIISKINQVESSIIQADKKVSDTQKQLSQLEKTIKKCPTCGKVL